MPTPRAKDNLEKIRQVCIAANPEIVELKFGCEIRHNPARELGIDYQGVYLHPARGKGMDLIFFEGERTGSQLPYSTTISEKDYELIGRPIRLADVLLAIGDRGLVSMSIMKGGDYATASFIWEPVGAMEHMVWNLLTDDLSLQSEETLAFLASLL